MKKSISRHLPLIVRKAEPVVNYMGWSGGFRVPKKLSWRNFIPFALPGFTEVEFIPGTASRIKFSLVKDKFEVMEYCEMMEDHGYGEEEVEHAVFMEHFLPIGRILRMDVKKSGSITDDLNMLLHLNGKNYSDPHYMYQTPLDSLFENGSFTVYEY